MVGFLLALWSACGLEATFSRFFRNTLRKNGCTVHPPFFLQSFQASRPHKQCFCSCFLFRSAALPNPRWSRLAPPSPLIYDQIDSPLFQHHGLRLACFFVFEVCCGVYWPLAGMLRSRYVPADCRATVLSLFRIPLNLLVILVLFMVDWFSEYHIFWRPVIKFS